MTQREPTPRENYAYWVEAYATDLVRGRDPNDFGMRWMAGQIILWREAVDGEEQSR